MLEIGLSDTQNNPAEMQKVIDAWLNLVKGDVLKLFRSSPWRRHMTVNDFSNLVANAYLIRGASFLADDTPFSFQFNYLMFNLRVDERAAGWPAE